MAVKRKKSGFTVVELITAVGIVALLTGLLIPALSMVRRVARETKQRAQFATIELALTAFKNDYGDYPPSNPYSWLENNIEAKNYCGAQKLAEALLGWDLLGFHPDSSWRADGRNRWPYQDPLKPVLHPPKEYFLYNSDSPVDMDKRKGPYLELATVNAFKVGDLFKPSRANPNPTGPLSPNTFVICDVFGKDKHKVTLSNGKTVKAGAPILYYKANTSGKAIQEIYRMSDDDDLIVIEGWADGRKHALEGTVDFFYDYIRDPRIAARPWPYRPDSYILISAGADGLYGTGDDIRNFED